MSEPAPTCYTFGSMSLGAELDHLAQDIRTVRLAMKAGVWFHSSPTYHRGFTYMVLRMAFDQDRAHQPPLILKIRDGSPELLRFETEDACRRLGIEAIDIAQLVSMTPDLVSQLNAGGGPIVEELASLRERGLIRQAVLYLHRSNADAAVEAAANPLINGVTLYWNAVQRDSTPSAWAKIRERNIPVLALRTLGGGPADDRLTEKRLRLAPLLVETGSASEVVFNLRLAASYPEVRTTIGGTANPEHLQAFLDAARNPEPLPEKILQAVDEIVA